MTHDQHATDLLDRLHGLGRDEPAFTTPVSAMIPVAIAAGRRRRIASLASRTLAVGVLVGLVAVTVGTLRPGGVLRRDLDAVPLGGTTMSSPASPVLSSSPETPRDTRPVTGPVSVPPFPCVASELAAEAAYSGQEMNQPFTVVRVTTRAQSPCTLTGYPDVSIRTAAATSAADPAGRSRPVPSDIAVTHGSIYQVVDPGSRDLILEPGGQAWFAVGTGLAYDGPPLDIREMRLAAPGGGGDVLIVNLQQQISGPSGKPLPLTVTAFAPGAPPNQQ